MHPRVPGFLPVQIDEETGRGDDVGFSVGFAMVVVGIGILEVDVELVSEVVVAGSVTTLLVDVDVSLVEAINVVLVKVELALVETIDVLVSSVVVRSTGDGVGSTGAGVGSTGEGVGSTGAGVKLTGTGVGSTGAGVLFKEDMEEI